MDAEGIERSVSILRKGGVVICPTDTIYGLIADATNGKAVQKIFLIKKRNKKKPLGIFVENVKMAKKFAKVDPLQERFLKKVWPGPVTVILKRKNPPKAQRAFGRARHNPAKLVWAGKLPKELGASKTIGIRVPKYDLIISLIKKLGHPLAQTSVNISNKPPMGDTKEMRSLFFHRRHRPGFIIDAGILPKPSPSKVVDYTGEKIRILRP